MENIVHVKKTWLKIFEKYDKQFPKNTIFHILQIISEAKEEYEKNEFTTTIFPKEQNIFKCFSYFDVQDIKVVILGQDPYHGPNQATGLSFGVSNNVRIPPSLRNISKELLSDLNISLKDLSLENWANQGILLLNTSLSVIQGKPGSQMSLWSDFTSFIINELIKNSEHSIIFVAWGAFAHNKLKNIDFLKHRLIISSHPSPLSVYKKYKNYPAFSGSKPFSQINKYLTEDKLELVEW